MSSPSGSFVWYELLANDETVATAFYPRVLGWTTEPFKTAPGQPPYTVWKNGSQGIGGLMTLPTEARAAGAPSYWLGYVHVADTDKSLAQAKSLGASIQMGPIDIPEVGRMAVIADPQGASLALFTPKTVGSGPMPELGDPGYVSWNELATDDCKKAWEFYHPMFGWQKGEAMDMGPMGTYQILQYPDGRQMGAMYNRPPQIPVSNWLYYFRVRDLDQAVKSTQQSGGKVINGPMDVPGGRIAQCLDPQGAMYAMHWMKGG